MFGLHVPYQILGYLLILLGQGFGLRQGITVRNQLQHLLYGLVVLVLDDEELHEFGIVPHVVDDWSELLFLQVLRQLALTQILG